MLKRVMSDKYPGLEEACLEGRWSLGSRILSHNRDIKGKLSVFISCDFTSLKTLILHDCDFSKSRISKCELSI